MNHPYSGAASYIYANEVRYHNQHGTQSQLNTAAAPIHARGPSIQKSIRQTTQFYTRESPMLMLHGC
jgi:hypothetical protein